MPEKPASPNKTDWPLDKFAQLPYVLFQHVKEGYLQPRDLIVYAAYLRHLGVNPYAHPGRKRISLLAGVSVSQVRRCLQRLKDAGHLARAGRTESGTAKTYFLTRVEKGAVQNSTITPVRPPKPATGPLKKSVKPEADVFDF